MAAINQRIPNFLGGVSQQPDTIKFPGQLRVCDNATPDVTFGLKKRPAGEFVKKLTNATSSGYWYEILRDGDEKYLIQITPANTGSHPIRVWALVDLESGQAAGTELSLTNSSGDSIYAYLAGATQAYSIQTIQDYTLICNPQKIVGTTGVTASPIDSGDYAFSRLDTIAYNTEYILYHGTAPTPNTYYRVTSLKVDKGTSDGPTWDSSDTDAQKAGQAQFSFSGDADNVNDAGSTIGGTNITEGIEGHILVNSNHYVEKQEYNWENGSHGTRDQQGNESGTTSGNSDDFLGFTQIYRTRYTATATLRHGGLIKGTEAVAKSCYIDVTVEGISYRVSVENVEPVTTFEGVSGIGYYKTPRNPDQGTLSMATILNGLKVSCNNSLSNVTAEVIGSGLYLTGSSASSVNFLGGAINENMSIIGQRAQDISRLPAMCKHGYIAQISNTDDINSDDYYVKFEADNGSKGAGSWEETVRPNGFSNANVTSGTYSASSGSDNIFVSVTSHGYSVGENVFLNFTGGSGEDGTYTISLVTNSNTFTVIRTNSTGATSGNVQVTPDPMILGLDPATMPHALVNNRNGTFTFKKLDEITATNDGTDNYWQYRQVGDSNSNPFPSFNGLKIQNIFFHRNRLGLIADEQVVLSRPGDYFNFFIVSSITTSDDNPIDITVSDIKPAFINHTLPINKGLMLFSDNGQFLLFTESDIFSPKTARLKKVSSYENDNIIKPVDLGTSVMFVSNVSAYSRVFESRILDDDIPPATIEQTRVVPEFIPKDITLTANSTPIGIVSYGKKGTSVVYHYKYFDTGDKRDQSAWYSWTLTGTMQHMCYAGGNYYVVTLHSNGDYILNKYEYVTDTTSARSYAVGGVPADVGSSLKTARWFEACLDSMTLPTSMAYTAPGGANVEKSVVTLPYNPTSAEFYLVALTGNDTAGNPVAGTVLKADSVSTNTATFLGINLTGWTYVCGYKYTAIIELPTLYLALDQTRYDTEADLRISGINFNMGVSGPMEFHLSSIYNDMNDYIHYETGMTTDSSNYGSVPSELQKEIRVPIQKKNEKYRLQIQIPDPFSTALISGSWDGIYNHKRHVRR